MVSQECTHLHVGAIEMHANPTREPLVLRPSELAYDDPEA